MSALLKAFEVTVQGFEPIIYSGRTAAKARRRAYRDYCSYDDRCTFAAFLKISTVRRAPHHDARHKRVLVCGKAATIIIHPNRTDLFVYDGSDDVMSAHPTEIEELKEAA